MTIFLRSSLNQASWGFTEFVLLSLFFVAVCSSCVRSTIVPPLLHNHSLLLPVLSHQEHFAFLQISLHVFHSRQRDFSPLTVIFDQARSSFPLFLSLIMSSVSSYPNLHVPLLSFIILVVFLSFHSSSPSCICADSLLSHLANRSFFPSMPSEVARPGCRSCKFTQQHTSPTGERRAPKIAQNGNW